MDIDKELEKIFEDDDLGLLISKPSVNNQCSEDERLKQSFEEINKFFETHNEKLPEKSDDILEKCLYFRLLGIKEDRNKIEIVKPLDKYNLLSGETNNPEKIEDVFEDDDLGILEDFDNDIFELKHVSKERATTDFVARRKPCKNFDEFENIFINCQKDLKNGVKTFEKFAEPQIEEGQMFVLNGMLVYVHQLKDIKRIEREYENKYDGRTHLIFENGTESNMRFRSFCKRLFETGKHVTNTIEEKMQKFNEITKEDKPTGYIYILQSRSKDFQVKSIRNLYKIGYCETTVVERIRNAQNEPTYLMAPVKIVAEYKTYNMNTQKFESLLHRIFDNCRVKIDVYDNNGTRHTPNEWFQIPYEIINQSIELIISGKIVNYIYDRDKKELIYINNI